MPKTLYLRNVPDDVVDRLQRLAEQDAMSVTAVAVRELAQSTRRVDNAAIFADAPDLGVDMAAVVEVLNESRSQR